MHDKSLESVTHELLANTMPFYCCWLVDIEDETKPCFTSVAIASVMYSANILDMSYKHNEWIN